MAKVLVIGAGLAGSEVAWSLAHQGIHVVLVESKKMRLNPAQKLTTAAELVCTNSLKSQQPHSAHGVLKFEMKALGSLILQMGELHQVPAGDALAVDREKFSIAIDQSLRSHPLIEWVDREIENPEQAKAEFQATHVVVATGPLTHGPLQNWLARELASNILDNGEDLYFYDAIAPVVEAESLDFGQLFFKDRYKDLSENEQADYLNAPMDKQQYLDFIEALRTAEKVAPRDFEEAHFFESCLPIDLMAERGIETARFGPMKPIGLGMGRVTRPYAVVQLRRENLLGEAFNLVGFQTRLTYPEQQRVFRMIPGLEKASFLHMGSVHRNTFVNSQKLLNSDLSSKKFPWLYLAGQITGVEGYTESAAMGQYVGLQIGRNVLGQGPLTFPTETAMGALINYLMTWQRPVPSNFNFGLVPPVIVEHKKLRGGLKKKAKKELAAQRANEVFTAFLATNTPLKTKDEGPSLIR